MPDYPRETTEFVSYTIRVDGVAVTQGVEFSVVPRTAGKPRPDTWTPAQVLDGKTGFLILPSTPTTLNVWARVTSTPELPVIDCGTITRT
jgi:hypothetical protein